MTSFSRISGPLKMIFKQNKIRANVIAVKQGFRVP